VEGFFQDTHDLQAWLQKVVHIIECFKEKIIEHG
jgi:hypothetical protein